MRLQKLLARRLYYLLYFYFFLGNPICIDSFTKDDDLGLVPKSNSCLKSWLYLWGSEKLLF